MKKYSLALGTTVVIAILYIGWHSSKIQNNFSPNKLVNKDNYTNSLKSFNEDYLQFQALVEESLNWRASAINEIKNIKTKISNHQPLTANDLIYLHSGSTAYLQMRHHLLRIAHQHKKLIAVIDRLSFDPSNPTKTIEKSGEIQKISINPQDEVGKLMINQFKMSLASALTLYDNFLIAIWPYQEDAKLRLLINFDSRNQINGLKQVTANYLDPKYRIMVHKASNLYQSLNKQQSQSDQYLDLLIKGSPSYKASLSANWQSTNIKQAGHWVRRNYDAFKIFKDESLATISKLFGNTVGLVETRKGKLLSENPNAFEDIRSQLKPLDILLEKTPFRLTDKLIPGHFGHVAIWLGTEMDLKKAGLWNDQRLIPYHQQIRNGHSVLEALRSGVQLSSLKHFLNVDDLTVARHNALSQDQIKHHLSLAIDQIGKEYDFNFDVETDKKIVCSELAYVVFPNVQWPIEKTVGRYTISPDNIAQFVKKKMAPFDLPILYHDGYKVSFNKRALQLLLEGQYELVKKLRSSRSLSSQ